MEFSSANGFGTMMIDGKGRCCFQRHDWCRDAEGEAAYPSTEPWAAQVEDGFEEDIFLELERKAECIRVEVI